MKLIRIEDRYRASNRWFMILAVVFLVPFLSSGQDCDAIVYLDSRTVKAGETLNIVAGTIINPPGKQFFIESGGGVTLQSGKRIELNYGFKALYGSTLSSRILPCDPDEDPKRSVVFPNPTDGVINVKSDYRVSSVRISDMSGFLLLQKSGIDDTTFSLDISSAKPGYYILELIAGKAVIESIRIEKR